MGRLTLLAETIMQVARVPSIPEDRPYRQALALLRDGVMPNGAKWRDGPPPLFVRIGGADTCKLVRQRQEATQDPLRSRSGAKFSVRFEVRPARGAVAGVSIDDTAIETFMGMAMEAPCDDHLSLERLAAALRVVAEERLDSIRVALRPLFFEDGLWRIVGWNQRDQWTMETLEVARVALSEAIIEKNRGQNWVAKRWEAWVPFTCDVEATLWRRS